MLRATDLPLRICLSESPICRLLMTPSPSLTPLALILATCLALPSHADDQQNSEEKNGSLARGEQLFTLRVLPVLKEKCFGCHGGDPDALRGELDLTKLAGILKGGESEEPAIVAGHPEDSILYQAVMWDGYEMPPKENDRLTDQQTQAIRDWILCGAPWPTLERQREIQKAEWSVQENDEGVILKTSGGLADEWTYRRYAPEDIWAFKPVVAPDIPADSGHPIDYFVNRMLESHDLAPAPAASRDVLLRRATYDLTGLPPTVKQRKDFQERWDQEPAQAWQDLIVQLLASDRYGERWAQHWLDVARYADTAGFSNDYERSNAWRYRDYVIRSFNEDKPYNEFVIEQIAGDELNKDASESTIATGFLRMGPWGTAMIPQPEARQIYLDDLVHNVGQVFMSLPMRCCKCHDHKFDPIPTRDYYAMYAAFAGTQPAEVPADFLPTENRNGFDEKKKLVQELLDFAKSELKKVDDKQENAARKWYEQHGLPYKNEKDRRDDPEDMKPPRHVGLTPEEKGIKKVREQDVWIWQRRLERFQPLAQSVYNGPDRNMNARKLRAPNKFDAKWRPESFILAGGALTAKSDAVLPGVLSAVGFLDRRHLEGPERSSITQSLEGRRLELAHWIASDENPLTARSFVNRVWQYHFGKGLVETANNFGAKGKKPTHPELLDWLTADFVKNGWKIKRLHQLIMTSATYQRSQASVDPQKLANKDPNNDFLSIFNSRRLTAEELRDSMLQISGELNLEMGGVPIMPEINMEVALQPRMIQFSIAPAHQPSRTPEERNRRTIYAYRVRGQADPFLEVMNQPNPNESCALRDASAVSPQAFTLLNSDAMTDRSIAFAKRVIDEKGSDSKKCINRAFQLAYGRKPSAEERSSLQEYLTNMQEYHETHAPEKVEYPTSITRSLVEEFTGEPFEFIEKLNVYEDYVADAKPWNVDAKTRALADVCLLIFNSNEFVYVY